MKKISFSVVSAGILLSLPFVVSPVSAMDGMEIMKKKNEAYLAKDQTATVTLHLFNKEADEKKIATKRYWKNYAGKEGLATKTLFFTEWPPDAKGTGFLIWSFSEPEKPDELWLYLPSLRQTRYVSSRDQDDAFMGSDLTFGDMGQKRLEEDDHSLLREEPCGEPADGDCFVVGSVAIDKEGIYSKKIHWISKKDFITMKVEYYDRKGELLKSQKITWQEVEGFKVWKSSEVINVQTRHKTIFDVSEIKINSGLKDDLFTQRTLQTGIR